MRVCVREGECVCVYLLSQVVQGRAKGNDELSDRLYVVLLCGLLKLQRQRRHPHRTDVRAASLERVRLTPHHLILRGECVCERE